MHRISPAAQSTLWSQIHDCTGSLHARNVTSLFEEYSCSLAIVTLMTQALVPRFLHILPISLRRGLPKPPPPPDHAEQARVPHKPNHRDGDVRVLVARGLEPGRDGVVDGEAERVADEHARDDHAARQLAVRRNGVVEGGRHAQRVAVGEQELAEDEPEPVDVVDDPDAVEDQREGHEHHGRREEVQRVFGLRDAVVAPREAHRQDAPYLARVVSAAHRRV